MVPIIAAVARAASRVASRVLTRSATKAAAKATTTSVKASGKSVKTAKNAIKGRIDLNAKELVSKIAKSFDEAKTLREGIHAFREARSSIKTFTNTLGGTYNDRSSADVGQSEDWRTKAFYLGTQQYWRGPGLDPDPKARDANIVAGLKQDLDELYNQNDQVREFIDAHGGLDGYRNNLDVDSAMNLLIEGSGLTREDFEKLNDLAAEEWYRSVGMAIGTSIMQASEFRLADALGLIL